MPAGLVVEFTYDGNAWAPTNAGTYAVTGTVNDLMWKGSASDSLVVARALDTITFSDTNHIYDGTARAVTAVVGSGSPVAVTYDGAAPAPVNVGTYAVTGLVEEVNWTATNTTTLTILKADQAITFPAIGDQETTNKVGLAATADSGFVVSFAVDSGPATIAAGTNLSFTGEGRVSIIASQGGDTNWNAAPDVTNTFNVVKAVATVTLLDLAQTYDGTARTVTATTMPAGLTVEITYDGSATAPSNAGTYAITGLVNDIIYQGVSTDDLVVAKADQTIANFLPTNRSVFLPGTGAGLSAAASSGLAVDFAVEAGPASIAAGTNLTFTNHGPVSVSATQVGNPNWNPTSTANTYIVHTASPPSEWDGDWVQINADGFGDGNNFSAFSMAVYSNQLFAGTWNNTTGCEVWRWDGPGSNDWTQVNTSGFGTAQNRGAHSMAVYDGRLYIGTGNSVTGFQVWAYDGSAWSQVASNGLGNAANVFAASMAVHDGQLFVGASGNADVFAYDGATWTPMNVAEFGNGNNGGIRSLAVHDGKLYAGVFNAVDYAGLYRYDGPTAADWTLVSGGGFEELFVDFRSLAAYNGMLYIGTAGWSTSCQVWDSFAGTLARNDPGNAMQYDAVRCMDVLAGRLYVGTGNDTGTPSGGQVWEHDGISGAWVQVNSNGFGNVVNEAVHSLASIGSCLFAGVSNSDGEGGKVYMRCRILPSIAVCTPTNGTTGTTLDVVIDGTGTHFLDGVSDATFSGDGLTVDSTTVTSPTQATVHITIDLGATQGARDVNVLTGVETPEFLPGGFTVKSDQALTFPAMADQLTTDTVELSATASSGLAVSFVVSSGPAVIADGTNLTFTGEGDVVIVASQAGDVIWNAAPDVTNAFHVTQATATVTLGNLSQTYDGTARTVTATTVPAGLVVEFTYDGSAAAPVDAGTYAVIGTINDGMYQGSAADTLVVGKADQVIQNVLPADGAQVAVGAGAMLSAQASSGLPVAFSRLTYGIARLAGNTLTFVNPGFVQIQASQPGNANWNAAAPVVHEYSAVGAPTLISSSFPARESYDPRFTQVLRIRNTARADGVGIRVLFSNLRPGIAIKNQTGISSDGRPMIEVQKAFRAGGMIEIRVTYVCTGRYRVDRYPPRIALEYILLRQATTETAVEGDFEGNGRANLVVFQPDNWTWNLRYRSNVRQLIKHGRAEAMPVPADYDGDGLLDFATYHPATGEWKIRHSSDNTLARVTLGSRTLIPVPGDYDGDGVSDVAVYRKKTGRWTILGTTEGRYSAQWGLANYVPVPADYDGDGITDLAVYNPANGRWQIFRSASGRVRSRTFYAGVEPVPADYDGDGKADLAIYKASSGAWRILQSSNGRTRALKLGSRKEVPVPADYDGDGKADPAIYDPSSGRWSIRWSSSGRLSRTVHGGEGAWPVLLNPLIHSWYE